MIPNIFNHDTKSHDNHDSKSHDNHDSKSQEKRVEENRDLTLNQRLVISIKKN